MSNEKPKSVTVLLTVEDARMVADILQVGQDTASVIGLDSLPLVLRTELIKCRAVIADIQRSIAETLRSEAQSNAPTIRPVVQMAAASDAKPRTIDQVYRAHDLMGTIIDHRMPIQLRVNPQQEQTISDRLEVLCWVLGHGEGKNAFETFLVELEVLFSRYGEVRRTPDAQTGGEWPTSN